MNDDAQVRTVPEVSILMTVFNGERFLASAIASVLGQTLADLELIIVDNGCTDGSPGIMASFHDPRIRVFRIEHTGRTEALNVALRMARADLIAVQDADDVSLPTRLARERAVMRGRAEVSLVATGWQPLDEHDRVGANSTLPETHEAIVSALAVSNPIAHSSVMFRRQQALALGGYQVEFAYAQDFALILRLAEVGQLTAIDEVLVQIRRHSGQASVAPALAVARARDCARLYRQARGLTGVPPGVRRSSRDTVAAADVAYAYAMRRSGSYWRACVIALRGLWWSPRAAFAREEFREIMGLLWLQRWVRAWRRRRGMISR